MKSIAIVFGLFTLCLYAQTAHASACNCDTFNTAVVFNATVTMGGNVNVGSVANGRNVNVLNGWIASTQHTTGAGPAISGTVVGATAVSGVANGGSPGIGGYFFGERGVEARGSSYGVWATVGAATTATALYGDATGPVNGIGIVANGAARGAMFSSTNTLGTTYGLMATCASNNCTAVYASAPVGQTAAYLGGNVTVSGALSVTGFITKAGGGFHIDNPEHPDTQFLNHGFVESEVSKNIYDGDVVLDARGMGTVVMPSWFDHVNTKSHLFAEDVTKTKAGPGHWILRGKPGQAVDWFIVATRNDTWIREHQPPTIQPKTLAERGTYVHPDLYGKKTASN